MKTSFLKRFPSSLIVSLTMLLVPVTSYATDLPSIQINNNAKIMITGAEVTSVSGDTITGIVKLKNATTSATIKTNISTRVEIKGEEAGNVTYSSSSIKVGDILNISGIFTGFTTSLTLTADKIHNLTSRMIPSRYMSGKVESINAVNNSFVMRTKDNMLITVVATTTTTFYLPNKATTTLANGIMVRGSVDVRGTLSVDGKEITASVVTISNSRKYKEKEDEKNNRSQKENKRFFGLWKIKDK